MVNCHVIQSIEEFKALETEWDSLLSRSHSNTIFLTWSWLFHWWHVFGIDYKLYVIILRKNAKLLGIAPLLLKSTNYKRILKYRSLKFLGSEVVGSDYLDFIIEPGQEQIFFREVFNHLEKKPLWDVIDLSDIPEKSKHIDCIKAESYRLGYKITHLEEAICPYAVLPATWNAYLSNLSSSQRYNVRRKIRKLEKEYKIGFEVISNGASLTHAIETLIGLNIERLDSKGIDNGGFQKPEFARFHQQIMPILSKQDKLRLCFLKVKGNPVAALYLLKHDSAYLYYQGGMRMDWQKFSPSTVLFAFAIKHAIEKDKIKTFDFLRGEEKYKFDWAGNVHKNVRISIFNRNVAGVLNYSFLRTRQIAKYVAKPFTKH